MRYGDAGADGRGEDDDALSRALCRSRLPPRHASPRSAAVPATVATCFTLAQRCTPQIVSAIDAAQREIRVQAYGFTSQPIMRSRRKCSERPVRANKTGTRRQLD